MNTNDLPAHLSGMLDVSARGPALPRADESLATKILAHKDALNQEMMGENYIDPNDYKPDVHDSRGDVNKARKEVARKTQPTPKKVEPKKAKSVKKAPKPAQRRKKKMEDLDAVMKKAEQHIQDETPEQEPQEPKTVDDFIRRQAIAILAERGTEDPEGALATLKQKHGSIYLTLFSEDELYIYTSVKRSKWKQIQSYITQLQENNSREGKALEEELTRTLVRNCLVYPALNNADKAEAFFQNAPAGVIDSLYTAVQQVSYFWTPQQVMSQTIRI